MKCFLPLLLVAVVLSGCENSCFLWGAGVAIENPETPLAGPYAYGVCKFIERSKENETLLIAGV